jgi:hypothetical protein
MSNTSETGEKIAKLQHVLDIYGADRTRWPAADRLDLAGFIASNASAREALAEATALDRLLDKAPRVSIERERALARRIVTAAAPLARPSSVVPLRRPVQARSLSRRAAALMAASLMLGIFAGASGNLAPAFDFVAEAMGLSDDEPELALANETISSGESL